MISTRDLMRRAETLADQLRAANPAVKRSTFLNLVGSFTGDLEEFRRGLELAVQGSGGHRHRTGNYGPQLEAAGRILRDSLDQLEGKDELDVEELPSLWGWTARMLYVRQELGEERGGKKVSTSPGKPTGKSRLPGESPPSDRQAVQASKLGLKDEALSGLAALKQQLEQKENGGS